MTFADGRIFRDVRLQPVHRAADRDHARDDHRRPDGWDPSRAGVETRFLKTLAKATDYTFLAGRLVVSRHQTAYQMHTITFRR